MMTTRVAPVLGLALGTMAFGPCGGAVASQGADAEPVDAGQSVDPQMEAALRTGLVAVWSLDGDAKDRSGNALDLQINGPKFGSGHFGGGLAFGGTTFDKAIRPVVDPALQLANGDFTASVWVNLDPASNAPQGFLDMGVQRGGWGVGAASAGAEWMFTVGNRSLYSNGNGNTPNGTFHHVVAMRTGSTLTLMVDQQPPEFAMASDPTSGSPVPFQLGDWGGGDPLDGTLDDIGIWNRALTVPEIRYLDTHAVPAVTP